MPDVQVPREVYIDDDLERTLDNIQKLDFSNIEGGIFNYDWIAFLISESMENCGMATTDKCNDRQASGASNLVEVIYPNRNIYTYTEIILKIVLDIIA